MLSFSLVLIVGLGSIGLYLLAYIYPEIHRKNDIWWSTLGCFYALSLLVYRRPVGLLLGHTASVILLIGLSYQALQRRWAMVEANPPKPEAGTISSQAREALDEVVAKIMEVDWQGLWLRMGTQADDGTSKQSILPSAIKQRLDFSSLGTKLKGMIGGKDMAETSSLPEIISSANTETNTPTVVGMPVPEVTPTPAVVPEVQPPYSSKPVPPIEGKVNPMGEQSNSMEDTSITEKVDDEPAVEVAATPIDPQDATKADLKAELDQVISEIAPEEQNNTPNLPQPPDPLG